jgi:hypothetical protein
VLQRRELWLFQRCTGARSAGARVAGAIFRFEVDALLRWLTDEAPAPPIIGILEVDLGAVRGLRFGFTDAAVVPDGRIAILACVEDSEDARTDGPILGVRFGWLASDELLMTDIVGEDGEAIGLKLEGIEPRPHFDGTFDVVADMDRPDEPSLLLELRVST